MTPFHLTLDFHKIDRDFSETDDFWSEAVFQRSNAVLSEDDRGFSETE